MSFNANNDKIAVTIPEFTVKKNSEGPFGKYCEPYVVSVAIDQSGNADPNISFNFMPFPKVANGGTVRMLGDGHIVYGPKNPGDFVATSILIMESDGDVRKTGEMIEKVIKSKVVDLGIGAVIKANPGSAVVLGILKELVQYVAGALKENGDDELFRTEGAFLRDHPVPYHINRSYETGNDYVALKLNVIPLSEVNGQGAEPNSLHLA